MGGEVLLFPSFFLTGSTFRMCLSGMQLYNLQKHALSGHFSSSKQHALKFFTSQRILLFSENVPNFNFACGPHLNANQPISSLKYSTRQFVFDILGLEMC